MLTTILFSLLAAAIVAYISYPLLRKSQESDSIISDVGIRQKPQNGDTVEAEIARYKKQKSKQ